MNKLSLKRLLILLMAVLFAVVSVGFIGCQPPKPTELTPETIAEYSKPGVILVQTIWQAQVGLPNLAINENRLLSNVAQMVRSGQLPQPQTDQDLVNLMLVEFLTNPAQYFEPAPGQQNLTVQLGGMGTGFIVTPDGYIVTNAHVVKMHDEQLKYEMASKGLTEQVTKDVTAIQQDFGGNLPQETLQNLFNAIASVYAQYMTVGEPVTNVTAYMGVAVPGMGTFQKGTPAEIKKIGVPSPGKDVAILKISANNLPTVPIGDDKAVRDGHKAIAMGYPGVATFNPMLAPSESNIKPSLTVGSISAHKTMPGGWEVFQTDTSITHGNSGGPLFNMKGEVIAMNTFGSGEVKDGRWVETQGFNFAIPVTIVNEFLKETNVTPTMCKLTLTYNEGVDLYFMEHYSEALKKFKTVQDSSPAYPYVQDFVSACTAAVNEGKDKGGLPIMMIVIIGGGVLLVGGFILILFLVILPKSRKKGAAPGVQHVQAEVVQEELPQATAQPQVAPEAAPPPRPTAEATKKHCPHCGVEVGIGETFCSGCGKPIS